jgi:hypothetical protein
MLQWAGGVFLAGMVLILIEWSIARKKKEGVTFTDRQRMSGLFWVTCGLSALAGALVWMA